jgi:hypothetical protein
LIIKIKIEANPYLRFTLYNIHHTVVLIDAQGWKEEVPPSIKLCVKGNIRERRLSLTSSGALNARHTNQ